MIDLVQRLRFDATRCEVTFSKGVASNIEEAAARIETLEKSLKQIAQMRLMPDDKINRVTLHAAIEVAKLHFAD